MSQRNLDYKISELRRTLAWMDLVMASINEAILVLDRDWRIIFANTALAEILGINRILLLGQKMPEVLPGIGSIRGAGIEQISDMDGVFEMKLGKIERKFYLKSKFVESLGQAVCVIDDISLDVRAEGAMMEMHKKVASLEAELESRRR